jgi:two-component system, chemotaxis family, CheB/CheR fusion protein
MSSRGTLADRPPRLVVGIGTSVGGLDAIREILAKLDRESSLSVVIIQGNLAGEAKRLSEQLQAATVLPVRTLQEPLEMQAGEIYLSPPQTSIEVQGNVLRSVVLPQDEQHAPIDHFFMSLANARKDSALGVILSGSGTDGTLGLKAISDAGGITLVQSTETAIHPSMPESATSLGIVDHVLPPDGIGMQLVHYSEHWQGSHDHDRESELTRQIVLAIPQLAAAVEKQTENDFKHYKTTTLARRIRRRIQMLKLCTVDAYLDLLSTSRDEAFRLFRDILISVTEFFRDEEAFQALAEHVIPRLLSERTADQSVRIWVAGCATGEEAYSLAMLVREAMDKVPHVIQVQIFATDLDDRALEIARAGSYPIGIQNSLSSERMQRFFVRKANRFHVTKELRDLILFSRHNLISDPPFTRQDLISCRNLMIYLGPHLQRKLVPLFHYALRPGGHLFLGSSEVMSGHKELFRAVDGKQRIYQRKKTAISRPGVNDLPEISLGRATAAGLEPFPAEVDLYQYGQRIVLDEFSPQWAIVDDEGHIHALSADTSPFLKLTAGTFQNNIVSMTHDGLRTGLRSAFAEAKKLRRKIIAENMSIPWENGIQPINITVQPMPEMGKDAGMHLVVFQRVGEPLQRSVESEVLTSDVGKVDRASVLIDQLERELSTTRSDLEQTVQELEATNEELKASNEELLSMNEELQSANEELETSKEDLQATNESLARSNSDIENLLRSTKIATVFLDKQNKIRGFTPAVTAIYALIESDVGRPISDLSSNVPGMPPLPLQEQLVEPDFVSHHTVQTQDGRWFIRNVHPYRSRNEVDGCVMTFTEVTELRVGQQRLEMVLRGTNTGAWDLDLLTNSAWHSPTHDAIFGYQEPLAHWSFDTFLDHIVPEDRESAVASFAQMLETGEILALECRIRRVDGEIRWIAPRGQAVFDESGNPIRAYGTVSDITERKRDAELIKNSESHLRRIIDNMVAFLGILDPEGRLIEVNQASLAVARLKREDVIGKKFWECYWWTSNQEQSELVKQAFETALTGQMVRYDAVARVAEDQLLVIDFMLAPVFDDSKNITHIIPSAVDISDRKLAENRIKELLEQERESADKFRTLADNIAQFAWMAEPDGAISWYNQRWFDYTGYNLEEMQSWGWTKVHHPDHSERVVRAANAAFESGQSWEDTFPLRRHDGVYRWFLTRMIPIFDSEGKVVRWFGTNTDVTEQKEAEERLRRSSDALQLGNELAGFTIAEVDYERNRVHLSKGYAELFGLPTDQLVIERSTLLTMMHPEDRDWLEQCIQSALIAQVEQILSLDHRIVRADGMTRWLSVRKQLFFERDVAGEVVSRSALIAAQDITAHKKIEADLEHARQLAEASNKAKSDFLANMSHEIRSPMTAILGFADLLKTENSEEREKVETIRRNGQFLLELVNDILDLSKIEAGKVDIDVVEFSPHQMLEEVCSLMSIRAAESGLELRMIHEGPIPSSIKSDPIRLRQVLINLVGNAIKFTDVGHVTLKLHYQETDRMICFDVIDTGIGISESQQGKLFKPFEQGDSSIVRKYGGSGLGLAISQRLAELMGGRINVKSSIGKGSTFSLVLPCHEAILLVLPDQPGNSLGTMDSPLDLSGGTVDESRRATMSGRLNIRVLIVDDRRDIRFLTQHLVKHLGGDVLVAENGIEALEVIAEEESAGRKLDIILMDVQMPKMDGFTAVRHLRSLGFALPIIALTANAMESDRDACFAAGYTDYLSKPINTNRLTEVLRRHCADADM